MMLTYRGKPIPTWFIVATLMLQALLVACLMLID
jgi:hypothetical protein